MICKHYHTNSLIWSMNNCLGTMNSILSIKKVFFFYGKNLFATYTNKWAWSAWIFSTFLLKQFEIRNYM